MTTFQLFLICVTTLGVVALAGAAVCARAWLTSTPSTPSEDAPPPRVGHRVTVHTKKPDDQTIFGVLAGDYSDRVVLEDAEYVTPQGGVPISGRQDIATRDIAWIDVHALVAPVPDSAPVEAEVPGR